MYTLRQKVLLWALYTRVFVLMIQFFINVALKQTEPKEVIEEESNSTKFEWIKVDTSNSENDDENLNFSDVVFLIFGGLVPKNEEEVQHNLHIANNGYTYENNLLYFPMYSLMVKGLSDTVYWVTKDLTFLDLPALPTPAVILCCSILLNITFFLVAVDRLYLLSRRVLKDEYLAYKAALFFCVSPTSVLFMAPLTLSVFSAACFSALVSVEQGMGLFTGVYLALASSAQPCGILTLLMVLYSSMRHVAAQTILYVKQKKKNSTTGQGGQNKQPKNNQQSYEQMVTAMTTIGFAAMVPGIWCIVSSLSPFAAFQWFGFAAFCKLQSHELGTFAPEVIEYGKDNNFSMPGTEEKPEWCFKDPPIPYMHIGGALELREPFIHWVPEEWPHYIACAPAFVLVLWQVGHFFKMHKRYCIRLGLVDNTMLGLNKPRTLSWIITKALPREALIYLLQALLLILSSISLASVQTVCRIMLACNPILYWIAALTTTSIDREPVPATENTDEFPSGLAAEKMAVLVESGRNLYSPFSTLLLTENTSSELASWTKIYFFGYLSLGTMIFASDFPGL